MDTNVNLNYTARGLTKEEVSYSRAAYGENRITKQKRKSFGKQFLASFGDPVIKILLIVLAINIVFMFRDFNWFETAGIALAVFLATLISTLSEYGSESAFLKMQEDAEKIQCRVKRAEGVLQIAVSEIVAGDIVLLQAGERIPADGYLISGKLYVDQSALNGESKESEKIPGDESSPGWDLARKNQLFQGCTVSSGNGMMRVANVGDATLYGDMAKQMQEDTRESPLKLRLSSLARTLSRLGYCAAGLVVIADLFNSFFIANNFNPAAIQALFSNVPELLENILHAILLGITVVVVAVPEGLPMMITVVLSANMKRMMKDHVLVRKLVGIETSGSLNMLFTDKTGTLTKGQLRVCGFVSGDGTSYADVRQLKSQLPLYKLAALSAYYNTGSSVSYGRAIGGNATDRALLDYFLPFGENLSCKKAEMIEFDSARKFSAVHITGQFDLHLVKGAPERILPSCTHFYDTSGISQPLNNRNQLERIWHERAGRTERVIALAVSPSPITENGPFSRLILIGLMCIRDEIRPEAAKAIREINQAGIQVIMVTGDNKVTAASIAQEVGLLRGSSSEGVFTSSELASMTDEKLRQLLPDIRVVARALPSDKSRLVRLAQEAGSVVGMTGDGINDAPALKRADVGFAMGSGTEVAKEAGDIVIMNDNIASIAKAVLYGRTIFKSIRKFIVFQLTMNVCAVGVSILGPFIGIDTPVTVVQMLWINMIMDTLGGLAFAGEAPLPEYMQEPPKRRDEPILNSYMINQVLFTGILSMLICTLFLKLDFTRSLFRFDTEPVYFLTVFFAMFIFCGIFNSFNARTHRLNLMANLRRNRSYIAIMIMVAAVQLGIIYFGGSLFRTSPLSFRDLMLAVLMAFAVVPIDLIRKYALKSLNRTRDF